MKSRFLLALVTGIALLLLSPQVVRAETESNPDSTDNRALDIYVDCDYCDFDFLKEEIGFVNFVRDRHQADLHLLVTRQSTGGAGRQYTVETIGKKLFAGLSDTASFVTVDSDTDDKLRSEMARTMKLLLVRYALRTPQAEHLKVSYDQPAVVTETVDKWNHWVFEISMSTWLNGEQYYRSLSLWGDLEAKRVTETAIIEIGAWSNYSESKFDYDDLQVLSLSRSKGIHGSYVGSIDDHWSYGFYSEAYGSTYSNIIFRTWNASGLEYNIFPYSESNRRELRLQYRLPMIYVSYEEETIFGKTEEWLLRQQLSASLEMVEQWGSARISLYGSNYLHDFKKNRLQLHGGLSFRLMEGLSLDLSGSYSRIRDQLALRKGDASEEEVLLRHRELETRYTYYTSVGISYSFGSIYSSIVNPRFGN